MAIFGPTLSRSCCLNTSGPSDPSAKIGKTSNQAPVYSAEKRYLPSLSTPTKAGAPKAGDKAAWGPRIAEGKATLYQHALNGYTGKTGIMPAKGGRTDLPDDLIKQGVDYMVSLAQ